MSPHFLCIHVPLRRQNEILSSVLVKFWALFVTKLWHSADVCEDPTGFLGIDLVCGNISGIQAICISIGDAKRDSFRFHHHRHHHYHIINPLPAGVVGAPHMILQPVFSIFPCSPLPCGTCRTPGKSIPLCCLPTFSSVWGDRDGGFLFIHHVTFSLIPSYERSIVALNFEVNLVYITNLFCSCTLRVLEDMFKVSVQWYRA